MDPNTNLARQRELAAKIMDRDGQADENDAYELAELVEALDGWLCGKGFLPNDWRRSNESARD